MRSLNRRLLLAAVTVLIVFLGLTGLVLDRAFRKSAEAAEQDRLQGHVYALLAAAEFRRDGTVRLSRSLPEARFSSPNSGLYARVVGAQGGVVWHSASMLGLQVPFSGPGAPGVARFERLRNRHGVPYFSVSFAVVWETAAGRPARYTFEVSENLGSFLGQVSRFRRNLWGWLAGVAVLLLAAQGSILRWGLAPLRRVAADLEEVKSGGRARLDDAYPKELSGLTESINSFIASERSQRDRSRNTLADLAHSLKTPLAVLRGALEDRSLPDGLRPALQEQVDRMTQIVDYQLQRAATSGRSTLAVPVALRPAVERVVSTLDKVYAARGIRCGVEVDAELRFRGDEGDLLEVLGNILENAYKWARSRIRVDAGRGPAAAPAGGTMLILRVEDDGPGIPRERRAAVLGRGVKADQGVGGHGIGLAVVRDILRAYGAGMELDQGGELGGARITLSFPDA